MSKYGNKRTVVDGITFDSNAEARRWSYLRLMEKAGEISGLERQVSFALVEGVRFAGEARKRPAIRYVADFTYVENSRLVIEDVKGVETPEFRLKRHLMLALHGREIRVTR